MTNKKAIQMARDRWEEGTVRQRGTKFYVGQLTPMTPFGKMFSVEGQGGSWEEAFAAADRRKTWRANRAARERNEAYRSCGLVKVRGSLGRTYWE